MVLGNFVHGAEPSCQNKEMQHKMKREKERLLTDSAFRGGPTYLHPFTFGLLPNNLFCGAVNKNG